MDLLSKLNQTCVYWSPPYPDGYGGYTGYLTAGPQSQPKILPDERECRWRAETEKVIVVEGDEVRPKNYVLLAEEAEEGGYLFLGTEAVAPSDPAQDNSCVKVLKALIVPSVDASQSLYKAYA